MDVGVAPLPTAGESRLTTIPISMTNNDEAKLVRRAKDGDSGAFAQLYDQHQAAIYRYIFYRVGSEAAAEDLTSEVFVRLVESIDDFTYRGRPLVAWLYTIARNLVSDHHRRRGRAVIVPLDESLQADACDPEAAADQALSQERLAEALEQLTEDQRQVLLLKFMEGLDNATVAQVLDKSYGAVKALQHRGLASLQRILDS
jgi:RNA polymerase sigma-70 factor (ECF subfamily)